MKSVFRWVVWLLVVACLPSPAFAQLIDHASPEPKLEGLPALAFFSTGDVDGNGLDDVVVIGLGDKASLSIYRQGPAGTFGPRVELAVVPGEVFSCLDVRDANGDGKAEILVERSLATNPPRMRVFDDSLSEIDAFSLPNAAIGGVTNCRFVDLQSAHGLDIVATKSKVGDGAAIAFFDGRSWHDKVFAVGDGAHSIVSPYGIAGGDFDNDGDYEVAVSELSSAKNGLHFYDVQPDLSTTTNVKVNPSIPGACGQLQEYDDGLNGTDLFVFGNVAEAGFYLRGNGGAMAVTKSSSKQDHGYIGVWDGEGVKLVSGTGDPSDRLGVYGINSSGTESLAYANVAPSDLGKADRIRVIEGTGDGRPDFLVQRGTSLEWFSAGPCSDAVISIDEADARCPMNWTCDVVGAGKCIPPTPIPPAPVTPVLHEPSAFRLGDINGDGHLDVVWSSSAAGSADMYIYYGNPKVLGKFEELTPFIGVSGDGRDVEIGDCNHDGKLDIITVGNSGMNNQIRVYKNLGGGSFTAATVISTPALFSVQSVAMGDVDDDGDLDIAVARDHGGVSMFANDGACGFGTSARWQSGGHYDDPSLTFYEGATGVKLALAHRGGVTIFDQFRGVSWRYSTATLVENTDVAEAAFGQWSMAYSSILAGASSWTSRLYALSAVAIPTYVTIPMLRSPPLASAWCEADTNGVATFLPKSGALLEMTTVRPGPSLKFAPPILPRTAKFAGVQCGGTNASPELILLLKSASNKFYFTRFAAPKVVESTPVKRR